MKKVVFSITRYSRQGDNVKHTGLGYITDEDLIIACTSKKGSSYIKVFEDCVKRCHHNPSDNSYSGSYYEFVTNDEDREICLEYSYGTSPSTRRRL